MRYILDEDGYILNVYFGCFGVNCTEYTGTIPEGYDSLIDWVENANIRAYKIVDGNLVYDEARKTELEELLKKENVLWEGAYFMTAGHSIDLSATPISEQPNGIVLVFSYYTNNAAQDYNFSYHFIPKTQVTLHPGGGHNFFLHDVTFSVVGSKYIYIADKKITGNANNDATGTGSSAIKYTNNRWVLRYVIGV